MVVIATAAVAVVGPAAAAAALLVVAPPLPPSAHGATAAVPVVVPAHGVLPRGAALAVHLGVVHLEVDRLKETVQCSAGVFTRLQVSV